MSREIKKPSLFGKLMNSGRNKITPNANRVAAISTNEFLDLPGPTGSDRSSTGSYTASCFVSPLRSRKFKKAEVEKLQQKRVEFYRIHEEQQQQQQEEEEEEEGGEDAVRPVPPVENPVEERPRSAKMRRSNTVDLALPRANSSEKIHPLKKSLLQKSHSLLSRMKSKSPKKKQQQADHKSPSTAAVSSTRPNQVAQQAKRLNFDVDWTPRESLTRALEGGQVCCPEYPSAVPDGSHLHPPRPDGPTGSGLKKPAMFFPAMSLTAHEMGVSLLPSEQAASQSTRAVQTRRRSPGKLSDISEESHVSETRMSHQRSENPSLPSAISAFQHSVFRAEDSHLGRPSAQRSKVIPQRPSSGLAPPGYSSVAPELNYYLGPAVGLTKSHSATSFRTNTQAEHLHVVKMENQIAIQRVTEQTTNGHECQGRQSRSRQLTPSHHHQTTTTTTRSLNEVPSRMSSYTSDLESGSPASSGVGSCKELRSVLPLVRSPNRSMEKTLGQVFLTYNEETKKSQLPNEVTSLDTLKALFVRSFPKQLTMQWFDNQLKKIYILDRMTSVYYEVDDLKEVTDRSQLKIYELDAAGPWSPTRPVQGQPFQSPVVREQPIASSHNGFDGNHVKSPNGGVQRHSVPCFPTAERPANVGRCPQEFLSGNSSGTITPLNGFNSDQSEKERMRKMEAQLANLSALVQSISTKHNDQTSNNTQPNMQTSIHANNNNNTNNSASVNNSVTSCNSGGSRTFMRRASQQQGRYSGLSRRVKDLRKELHQIRDLQVEFMNTIRISLHHLVRNFKNSTSTCSNGSITGSTTSAAGKFHLSFDASSMTSLLEKYKKESLDTSNGLRDLEFLVEELRCDVVNRKCKVNAEEVEGFAMCLSHLSKSLANLKSEFPRIRDGTKAVISEDVDVIGAAERFLSEEPARLEKSLRQTKKLMSVLYTLKKLSSLQANQRIEPPVIEAKTALADVDKKILFANIESIEPDHEMRAIKLEKSLRARELKRKIQRRVERMKFENHIRGRLKTLRSTRNLDLNLERSSATLVLLYRQQLANGGKRLSFDAQEEENETETETEISSRNIPDDDDDGGDQNVAPSITVTVQPPVTASTPVRDPVADGINGHAGHEVDAKPPSLQRNGSAGHVHQCASSIKPSKLTAFKAIHEVTSPPVRRAGTKLAAHPLRTRDGVASETDPTSFEGPYVRSAPLEESESEESCCSIGTIKRVTKVRDHHQQQQQQQQQPQASRSSVLSLNSSPLIGGPALDHSPLVLSPPPTLSSTLVTIHPAGAIAGTKSNPSASTTTSVSTFSKPPSGQSKPTNHVSAAPPPPPPSSSSSIPSSRLVPPPVPVRKTSTLSKTARVTSHSPSGSPLYSNLQEMRRDFSAAGASKGGAVQRRDGESKPKEMRSLSPLGNGTEEEAGAFRNPSGTSNNGFDDVSKKRTDHPVTQVRRTPGHVSTPRRGHSPSPHQEGILMRPSQRAAGSRPAASKNVKFKPDGNKCEETEIN